MNKKTQKKNENNLNKLTIAINLMRKYLNSFKNKNSFYFNLIAEIGILKRAKRNIQDLSEDKKETFNLNNGELVLINDILKAKKIKYGKFEYKFMEGLN